MSVRFKTILGIVLIEIIALAVIVTSVHDALRRAAMSELRGRADTISLVLGRLVADPLAARDDTELDRLLEQMVDDRGLRAVEITNEAGETIARAGTPWAPNGLAMPRDDTDTPDPLLEGVFVASRDLRVDGSAMGRMQLTFDTADQARVVRVAYVRMLVVAAFEVVASVFFAWWLGGYLAGRLSALREATRRIAEGDFDVRIERRTDDDIGETIDAFNSMADRLRRQIDVIKRESGRRESMETELRIGREIQSSLLPSTCPVLPGRPPFEIHVESDPMREVAGDFHDYFTLDDRRIAVMVGDIAGKGVPAGLFAAVSHSVLRSLARDGLLPDEVFERANASLSETNPRQLFATTVLLHVDIETGEACAAVAGHPATRIVAPNGDVRRVANPTGPVLGIIADQQWTLERFQLAPGEVALLVTDGVLEARNNDGEMLGEDGFDAIAARARGRDATAAARTVLEAIHARESTRRGDDVTVLALRIMPRPSETAASRRDRSE